MTDARHRGNPDEKPTSAQRNEFARTSTQRAAARNGMSLDEYKKYASSVGTRTHPLWKPGGLLFLAILMTAILGFLLVLAGIAWVNDGENLLASLWFIMLLLVALTVWAWVLTAHEYRAARLRKRDGVSLIGEGRSSVPDSPDPGGSYV
jgi:hypothetical protein